MLTKKMINQARVGICFITPLMMPPAFADLVFSAPPRESAEEARQTYEPMAKFLTEVIGEPVQFVPPRDWLNYTTDMRGGKYDIVFDGPHFAAWRMRHLNHVALVKLPGTLDFVVLTRFDDKRINKLRDLIALPVCGLPSPNLGTMTIMAQFNNPVTQPEFNEVKGGFDDVLTAFNDGKCRAAVVRDNTFKKLADVERKKYKAIFKSPSFPNQTFTVGDRVRAKAREQMIAALTVKSDLAPAERIFKEFSKNAKFFVPATASEFDDLESLLEGVVWGW